MDYLKRVIVLNGIENGMKGFLVFEKIQSTVSAYLNISGNVEQKDLKLIVSVKNDILSPINVRLGENNSFRFLINNKLNLNNSICACVAAGAKELLYGSTDGENKLRILMNKPNFEPKPVRTEPVIEPAKPEPEISVKTVKTEPVITEPLKTEMHEYTKAHEFQKSESINNEPERLEQMPKETKQFKIFGFSDAENNNEENIPIQVHSADTMRQEFPKADVQETSEKEIKPEVIEEILEKRQKESTEPKMPNYFGYVKSQIEDMFNTYPEEKILNEKIPNSKWIHIDYNDGLYYTLGIIYENDSPKKIGYAVPSKTDFIPPISSEGYAKWIEVKHTDKYGREFDGFYVLEQNAESGEVE